ncbi:MAG: hypothetical protein ABI402_03580 [Ferruginibacter sp.]
MQVDEEDIVRLGLSGKIGDEVYYKRNGKTFVRKAPGSYNKIPSRKQAIERERFKQAHLFALSVINDPALKAAYNIKAKGLSTAYIAAVSEFL